ncbi:MAG: hypothetical protein OIF35_01575, partial [Cellvibrionaceae bacterium]|nr:hypothetical protein [Cellvibrionaceae bacterium]
MCSPNKGLVAVLWAGLLAAAPNLAAQAPSAELIAQYRQAPSHWPALASDPGVSPQELGPLAKLAHPAWQTEAVEQLGKQLFFDPRLSASGQIACASCHDPQLGWADGRRNGFGAQRQTGRRNTMSILNSAYFSRHFWDGRAEGLAAQALGPIENPVEMNAKLEDVLATLNTIPGYRQQFSRAFGIDTIDAPHLGKAIAAFERTVVSRASKFDHFVKGDYQRLSDQEIHGLHLFRTKARCINCHNGPEFSDDKFHNIGLSYYGRFYQDLGRYDITGQEQDKGKFRTPSLRDIAHTGPYMHNGL